jgi:hypothetical protein
VKIPTMEELLEQGLSYDLSERLSLGRRPRTNRWMIYWEGCELHFKANPKADARPFPTAAAALAYLATQAGHAALVAVGAETAEGEVG